MTSALAAKAYEDLKREFDDADEVTLFQDHLMVHGVAFAFVKGDDLVVWLPQPRVKDLITRGFARPFTVNGHPSQGLVVIDDLTLWSELAHEAHVYMGEPRVGGQS